MKLTIGYITARENPRLDWTITSLAPQLSPNDEVELLVVDARERCSEELFGSALPRGLSLRVVSPKPTPWQGAYRLTSRDWWAKSSAMNTALVFCDTPYIAFMDDCARLGPKWLDVVRSAEQERRSVIAGAYEKIEQGRLITDHRRDLCPHGKANCGGGWLYGCTFALPLEWALEVNGAEEGCDGMGGMDYILGFMLENNGHLIDFVPDLFVTLERPEVSNGRSRSIGLRWDDKGPSEANKREAALSRFRGRARTEFSPDLRVLREARHSASLAWPLPDPELRDWFDGQLVREMS